MKNYYVDILVQKQISDLYGKISKKKKIRHTVSH